MAMWKCPGQDRSFWKPEDIFESPCPHCGQSIEFWKDDVTLRCPGCKQLVTNPKFDPGCAAWCSYASKCLGELTNTIQSQPRVIKNRLEVEMRKKLARDPDLLNLSLKASKSAEKLACAEKMEPLIPVAACLVGVAARKKGWSKEEILSILNRVGIDPEMSQRIYQLISDDDYGATTNSYLRVFDKCSGQEEGKKR